MKIILFFLLFGLVNGIKGQGPGHQLIPGTNCSLVPPAGFVLATGFTGFQNMSNGASIMVMEIPAPIDQLNKGFTPEALKAQGMVLLDEQTIDFNNGKAQFFTLRQVAYGTTFRKHILLFGDGDETILVNGIYPEVNGSLEPEIRKAMLSIIYEKAKKEDPLAAAGFRVAVEGTDFKFVRGMGGMLLYSTDGRMPTDKPTLIVGSSLSNVAIPDKKQFSIDRAKQLPRGEANTIKDVNAIEIDQLPGYEIVAEGVSQDGKPQLTYQVLLFEEQGGYYMIIGRAAEALEKNLQVFRAIAKSFKRK